MDIIIVLVVIVVLSLMANISLAHQVYGLKKRLLYKDIEIMNLRRELWGELPYSFRQASKKLKEFGNAARVMSVSEGDLYMKLKAGEIPLHNFNRPIVDEKGKVIIPGQNIDNDEYCKRFHKKPGVPGK
ncbi:hypothetical protein [Dysgonomonas termitidis]|uniref:Cell division protein FtsL n=1 Tax=Dysgonomonas termitidis TaxID=1516126 RepID=A0ABV9KTN7_9BACT